MTYMKRIGKGMLPYVLAASTIAYTTPQTLRAEEPKQSVSIDQLLNDVSGMSAYAAGDSSLVQLASAYRVVPGKTRLENGKEYDNKELYNHWKKSMSDEKIKASRYGHILQEEPDLSHLNSPPKPIYKKWWFWTALAAVAGIIGYAVSAGGSKGGDSGGSNNGGGGTPTDPDGNDGNQPNI